MLASLVVRLLTNVFVFVVLARVWGPREFGEFMYPFTVATLLVMIVDYGFGLQLVRDVGRSPHRVQDLVHSATGTKLLLTVGTVVLLGVAGRRLAPDTSQQWLLWLLLAAAGANSFGLFFSLPFRGLGRFELETRATLVANVALFGAVLLAAAFRAPPVSVACVFLLARLAYVAVSVRAYQHAVGALSLSAIRLREAVAGLRVGFPYGVHIVLGTLYFQLDTVLVQYFLGAQEVGIYQAGVRLLMAGMIFADVLSGVYLPMIASATHDTAHVLRTGRLATRQLILIGVVGFLSMALAAGSVTRLFYGQKYDGMTALLPLFGVVLLLRYATAAHGVLLTVADKQSLRALAVTLAAVVNLLLNLVLIPAYSLWGAVLAAVLTHAVLDAIYVAFVWKEHHSSLLDSRAFLALGLATLLGIVRWLLGPATVPSIALFLIGILAVAALALADRDVMLERVRGFVRGRAPVA